MYKPTYTDKEVSRGSVIRMILKGAEQVPGCSYSFKKYETYVRVKSEPHTIPIRFYQSRRGYFFLSKEFS
jgi:hypothetical protein